MTGGADATISAQMYVWNEADDPRDHWSLESAESSTGAVYDCQALCMAVLAQSLSLVRLLATDATRSNATANVQDDTKPILFQSDCPWTPDMTPLKMAAARGNTPICFDLLDHGANINATDQTALMEAAFNGHTETCSALMDRGAHVLGEHGRQALLLAVRNGHTETCRTLLERGAEVDAKSRASQTALIWAAHNGHADICRLILEKGANVDDTTAEGMTALMYAANNGNEGCVRVLLEHNASAQLVTSKDATAILFAMNQRSLHISDLLIQYDPSCVNFIDKNGNTLLHFAVIDFYQSKKAKRAIQVAKYLLAHGVNALAKNGDGETALAKFLRMQRRKHRERDEDFITMHELLM